MSRLVELCRKLDEPTLIYCRSPKRAHEAAQALCTAGLDLPTDEQVTQAVEWVSEHYHPQWTFVDALRHGVGIHHGRIPRALGHWLVSAFNKHQLRFLICTSTLIEGVNKSAKNVIVFGGELNKSKLDLFTFTTSVVVQDGCLNTSPAGSSFFMTHQRGRCRRSTSQS